MNYKFTFSILIQSCVIKSLFQSSIELFKMKVKPKPSYYYVSSRWVFFGRCFSICLGCILGMWPLLLLSNSESEESKNPPIIDDHSWWSVIISWWWWWSSYHVHNQLFMFCSEWSPKTVWLMMILYSVFCQCCPY